MHRPKIDIAIPNYNYGHYLEACITSVLSQEDVDLRLLIIDNASTDNSREFARSIAGRDHRVELCLREKNLGSQASFNQAVDWAESDYFLILCSDDMLAPGALKRAVDVMEKHKDVHLVYGNTVFIDANGSKSSTGNAEGSDWQLHKGEDFIDYTCRHALNPAPGPTVVVRTSIQKRVGHYREALPHTDDLEMWLRIASCGNVASTQAVQAFSRVHEKNLSATVKGVLYWSDEFEKAFHSFFNNEGINFPNKEELLSAMSSCLSKRAYWSALHNLITRKPDAGRLLKYALKRRPSMVVLAPLDYIIDRRERHNQRPKTITSPLLAAAVLWIQDCPF